MLDKTDLKAIAELIKAEGDLIRRDMATKTDLKVMGEIIKIELAVQKREIMGAMKLGFRATTKAIIELEEKHGGRIGKLEKQQKYD